MRTTPQCWRCADQGFYLEEGTLALVACACKAEERAARIMAQARSLPDLDGLTPTERTLTFSQIGDIYAIGLLDRILAAVQRPHGIVVLSGPYGQGKSHLLKATCNHARQRGMPGLYRTTSGLLDTLRATFDPAVEERSERIWQIFLRCPVLAIDEMDAFHATPWALDRFTTLVDERHRRMDEVLTLFATNLSQEELAQVNGKVASRLLVDGRVERFEMRHMAGGDMRAEQTW